MPDIEADVVIMGGGISGLLLASELARDHKTVVIEKNSTVRSPKYWLTDKGCADHNPDLKAAIDSGYEHMDFISYDQFSYRCIGSYVLWDTDRLIDELRKRIVDRQGSFLLGHTFYSYRVLRNEILVRADDKTVRARLAIDCMGYASPIIYAKGIVDVAGYYLLYGATFTAAERVDPVGLYNMALSAEPTYLEAFPASGGKLHLVLIKTARTVGSPGSLKSDFDFIVTKSPFRDVISDTAADRGFLGGVVPVGKLRRKALDHLFFFGEAGQMNPAATATALTRMLYSYKEVAERLSERIRSGLLSSSQLAAAHAGPASPFDKQLQMVMFKDILEWNSDRFARVVREMALLNRHELVNGIMFGQLHLQRAQALGILNELASKGCWTILSYLLRGALLGLFRRDW
jgi:hypothetical protein